MRIIPARDEENMRQKLGTLLLAAVEEKPDITLSVFAGTPAFGAYKLLVERARAEATDFSRVRFVVFDELVGIRTRKGASPFRAVLDEKLFQPLGVKPENVASFDPSGDPAAEVRRIADWIALKGIDIAILSLDSRGHIGFHGSGADLETGAGIVGVEHADRWGTDRAFSLGLADLGRAQRILLFASGKNLAEMIRLLTEGSFDPSRPISVLQRHPEATLIADADALSGIEKTEKLSGFHSGLFLMTADSAPSGRRVIVVSPHPDDAPISVGGTMALLAPRNRLVTAVMSTGHRSFIYGTQRGERIAIREEEVTRESRILGVEARFLRLPFYDADDEATDADVLAFRGLLEEIRPDWIFVPQRRDAHPTHVASRRIVMEAVRQHLKETGGSIECWNYEGPWSLFNRGEFNAIVAVPRLPFERKLQAIRAHASQLSRTPYDVAAESLARLRSALVPESELSGYGAMPPRLEPWLELFYRENVRPETASSSA